jgi:hypothetical protein
VDLARADLALWERDPDGLLRLLEESSPAVFETQLVYLPKSLYSAWAHQLRGDQVAARAAFDSARIWLEPLARTRPEDERVRSGLGYAYAGLGRTDAAAAVAEGITMPGQRGGDASFRYQAARVSAEILAQARVPDGALRYLEELLGEDSPVTVHTLRLNPLLDPLRDDPGFQALLERYADVGGR